MSSLPASRKKGWPYVIIYTPAPIVYIYKQIQLYPVTDSSTWPFPIRKMNMPMFKDAMDWLAFNNISILGNVDYSNPTTQTITIKFTSELDIVAFTLQFGELLI